MKNFFLLTLFLLTPISLFADNKDQLGMAKHLGNETWSRCALLMQNNQANVYELSYERSGSMPLSPFAGKFETKFLYCSF